MFSREQPAGARVRGPVAWIAERMESEFLLAAARVNARLFIGGDDEFILLQSAALSLAGASIQHPARLGSEIRIAWK